jgi:hypothetical protein
MSVTGMSRVRRARTSIPGWCDTTGSKPWRRGVYPIAEIKTMDNGMKPPINRALLWGGGWNCRHMWSPHAAASASA